MTLAEFCPSHSTLHLLYGVLKFMEAILMAPDLICIVITRVIPQDERVQRFERARSMSVSSLKTTFQHLSQGYLHKNRKVWEDLMADKRLWKLAKDTNPTVCVIARQ